MEERERAKPVTPTNYKSDGEEPQGVEGWGRWDNLQLVSQGPAVLRVAVGYVQTLHGGPGNRQRGFGCSEEGGQRQLV